MAPATAFWRAMQDYVDYWSVRYPCDDIEIASFAGRKALTLAELDLVLQWKLQSTQNYLAAARTNIATNSEEFVVDSIARAISCEDDQGAILILVKITGVGLAIGSAILMATAPDRFTVYDERAVASLKSSCVDLYAQPLAMGEWGTYLNTCRRIARETERPLRSIDRALWAANGQCGGGVPDPRAITQRDP